MTTDRNKYLECDICGEHEHTDFMHKCDECGTDVCGNCLDYGNNKICTACANPDGEATNSDNPDDLLRNLDTAIDAQAMRDGERREEWRWRFAGMALNGILAGDTEKLELSTNVVSRAVQYADALIAALERGEGETMKIRIAQKVRYSRRLRAYRGDTVLRAARRLMKTRAYRMMADYRPLDHEPLDRSLMCDWRKDRLPQLQKGCGYMGYDFGAGYVDSQCFGGRLYDLDNCDEPGTLNEPMDYIACPQCNHEEWLESVLEDCGEQGYIAGGEGLPREFPAARDKMRFPEDFERCRAAWLSGWDEGETERGEGDT